jgi:integrase
MNRVVRDHLRSIAADHGIPDDVVVAGGGARPNARFRQLCDLAAIGPKVNVETGKETKWNLKDLRKTCATHYDAHMPESSIEILGHSVGGVTYRHYAHRDPLAFKAIMTIPQPTAFLGLTRGIEGMCPCCRREFEAAN